MRDVLEAGAVLRTAADFDADWYAQQYPDVLASGMDPREHFLWIGSRLGRKPRRSDHAETDANTQGEYEAVKAFSLRHGLFDAQYYSARYPDVHALNGEQLFDHYFCAGYLERRNPSRLFSDAKYCKLRPDVPAARVNPLVHYVLHGRFEGIDLEHVLKDKVLHVDDVWSSLGSKPTPCFERRPSRERTDQVKLIAHYLPQFHHDAHNDAFWGVGFTEWTNVTKSKPNFPEHDQPSLPLLGFYNLHDERWLEDQCRMAKAQGISGFNIFLYDFPNTEPPLFAVVPALVSALTNNGLEFCFQWANEPWTRRWDGLEKEVLIAQPKVLTRVQAERFVDRISAFMKQPNYLRVNGKKLFNIYRPSFFDDPGDVAQTLRTVFADRDIDVALGGMLTFDESARDSVSKFYDLAVEYPPHDMPLEHAVVTDQSGCNLVDYSRAVRNKIRTYGRKPDLPCYPSVFPSWDNTPRRGKSAWAFVGVTENRFANWLGAALDRAIEDSSNPDNIVFINSWNEWAEGANLEPDVQYGYWKLNAVSSLKDNYEHALSWQKQLSPFRKPTANQLACLWHVYFDDDVSRLCEIAQAHPDIDHFVTVNISTCGSQIERLDAVPNVFPLLITHRGRDFRVLAEAAPYLLDRHYKATAKCHFKRRNQIKGLPLSKGDLFPIIEDTLNAARKIASTASERREILHCRKEWILPQGDHLGSNEPFLREYAQDMGMKWDRFLNTRMPSGGFFVIEGCGRVFEQLAQWIAGAFFEYDSGDDDGTLAHAIERIVGAHYETIGDGMRDFESR